MLGRRLLALVLVVLCITGWAGVSTVEAHGDELMTLAGPGVVGRTATDPELRPEGSTPNDALAGRRSPMLLSAGPTVAGLGVTSTGVAPVLGRKGDPGSPRGPPLRVMS